MAQAWKIAAASVTGVSHVKAGLPCQDAHVCTVLPGGVLFAAVSDGAGSAALAEVGARTAVAEALAVAQAEWTAEVLKTPAAAEAFLQHLLQMTRNAVEREAARRDAALRDLAATLIVLLVSDEAAAAAQVGDGAAVLQDDAGALLAFTAPQQGEYVNETTFLIAADWAAHTQFRYAAGRFVHAALFSDGLQRLALKLPEAAPHAPFFAPLFHFVAQTSAPVEEALRTFLQAPRLAERADDDLTLVLAVRAPA